MNKKNINVAYNKMNANEMNRKVQELSDQISACRRATDMIYREKLTKSFKRGYWVKNYVRGYRIMKPLMGDNLQYNIKEDGRNVLINLLENYQIVLTNQMNVFKTQLLNDIKTKHLIELRRESLHQKEVREDTRYF